MPFSYRRGLMRLVVFCLPLAFLGCSDEAPAPTSTAGAGNGAASTDAAAGEANEEKPAPAGADEETQAVIARVDAGIARGLAFLASRRDAEFRHPGMVGLAALAWIRSPQPLAEDDRAALDADLAWLASLQKEDGSIYLEDSANYVTSIAVTALAEGDPRKYATVIERGRGFLVRLQADEDEGYGPGDRFYGGVGYGSTPQPDLSNTQFALTAVRAAGLEEDHAFWDKAVTYLQRTQNRSESNDQVWTDEEGREIRPGDDGGAMYKPGDSKAGVEEVEPGRRVFVSYGSMSYALLKSYLFCGLDRRDPRVRAVADWCRRNFELDRHPGFRPGEDGSEPYQGLYYYYFSMATSLGALGDPVLIDEDGVRHVWARELAAKLLAEQEDEGSFVNERNARWQEDIRDLVTSYAVLAMEECRKNLARS